MMAQTGPGGFSNSTSNGLWLRADAVNQANNTALTSWLDFSGNANNATQPNAALQPIYLQTSALNNMPIIRFDGANDEIFVPDSPILDGTVGITFYTVLRPNNLNGSPRGILGKRITFTAATNYAYTWFFHTGNRLNLDVNTQNNRFNTGATTFANATNYMLSWNYDGTLPAANRSSIRNSASVVVTSTETSTSITDSNQDMVIGALNVGYGTYLGADYAEVIHYNYALNNLEHLLVQNYLSAKYNIPLTANDLYDEDNPGNGNFDFDVAGIGQVSATEINSVAQGSGTVRILNPTNLTNNKFLIWGHNNGIHQAVDFTDAPPSVEARFDRVWRASEVNSSLTPVDVGAIDIQFDLTGLGAVTASDLRLLVDTDNDGVFIDETPIAGAANVSGNTYGFTGVTQIQNNLRFTLATINKSQTPLPIDLTYFNAALNSNNQVDLEWQTKSELNNDLFEIQKSRDGDSWNTFVTIDGAGNSSSTIDYSSIDIQPYSGISYYRLKQIDFNGNFTYSEVRSINISNSETQIQLYPNPFYTEILIQGEASELANLKIYNSVGQEVTSEIDINYINENKVFADMSALSSGVYVVKSSSQINRVVKQ